MTATALLYLHLALDIVSIVTYLGSIKMTRSPQLALTLPRPRSWGGARTGAGRKPTVAGRPGVPHRYRPTHKGAHPAHVTMKVVRELPSLRSWRIAGAIGVAIRAGHRSNFRVVEFSVMPDHIHLVVEGADRVALMWGLKALAARLAKRINSSLGRRGRVFADRYHARDLASPTEVRRALAYVLLNFRKHTKSEDRVDPCSTGSWFTGWKERLTPPPHPPPTETPRTWLLSRGWRRLGLISLDEAPAEGRPTGRR